jgi:hypothetical protein
MMSCDKGKYLGDKESNLKVSENAVKAYDNMINSIFKNNIRFFDKIIK